MPNEIRTRDHHSPRPNNMSPSTDLRENREFASEIKFLVTPVIAAQIRDWARGRLISDPNASDESGDGYQITSLYFDRAVRRVSAERFIRP